MSIVNSYPVCTDQSIYRIHYENTPIQMYRKFHLKKKPENFQIKNSDSFHIPA